METSDQRRRVGRARPIQHTTWGRFFASNKRIHANHVRRHPNFPAHDHEFMEITLIVGGSCLHRTVLGEGRVHAGDAFLFRPGAWHAYEEVEDLDLYNCCFDTSLLSLELSWMIDHPWLGRLLWSAPLSETRKGMVSLHLSPPETDECRGFLNELCRLAHAGGIPRAVDRIAILLRILNLLGRRLRMESTVRSEPTPAVAGSLDSTMHSAVASALRAVDEQPEYDWSLGELAHRVHVERTYFVRLFRKAVGLPPMAYLARRRAELAAGLLRRTTIPVGEIGGMVGWPDANQFSRRFRQAYGISPREYRRRSS